MDGILNSETTLGDFEGQLAPELVENWSTESEGFQPLTEKRALKGSVKVQADRGWLRLRWSWSGRRYVLAMGLPDGKVNRAIAEGKARLIERDILLDQFDPTLVRYKSELLTSHAVTVVELFERFIAYKAKQCDPLTLQKYWGLLGYLRQFFRQRGASQVTEEVAFEFRDWLKPKLELVTLSERLGLLRACWQWGMKRQLVSSNPWSEVKVRVPPKQKPKPFTQEESKRIWEGFRDDPVYAYYLGFVEFLLLVGCRIGEAAGLKWGHLVDDCSAIWIGESYSRGRQKATKTNEARQFVLSPRVQQMLLNRRPEKWKPDDYVFVSPQGKPIDDHNFRNRAWKPILERVGVEYRKPSNSRHTFVSHAIAQGWSAVEVSEITGHSVRTLERHYLGNVRRVQLPEIWN